MVENKNKISIQDLTIRFGETTALKGFTLDIFHNEIFTIIGPANSGKSSLLQSLNRLNDLNPSYQKSGTILLDGKDIEDVWMSNYYASAWELSLHSHFRYRYPSSIILPTARGCMALKVKHVLQKL